MAKILVTGGPVHAHLDAVKVITNRFKGGRMLALADELEDLGHDVTYLTSSLLKSEFVSGYRWFHKPSKRTIGTLWFHEGFDDYRHQVVEMAADFDGVVLGAAVANLIPVSPWTDKFPSHNYNPGDEIDLRFMVAPRIIDEVHKRAPKTQVFGFKLLQGAPQSELVEAALDVCHAGRCAAVFANDANNLDTVLAVSKEGAAIPMARSEIADVIERRLRDVYYTTRTIPTELTSKEQEAAKLLHEVVEREIPKVATKRGYIFGTVAVRIEGDCHFATTTRGKKELSGHTVVIDVDHEAHEVVTKGAKATMNAPLLARIFAANPTATTIIHRHEFLADTPTLPFAPAGTVADTMRTLPKGNFNIDHHGCFEVQ